MTAAEFKKKWARYQGKETSGYSEHFNDLCRLLGQPTPAAADPSGSDYFCFQKRVVKDAELFSLDTPENEEANERGFADVWKKGCFAWEYKGKKKNLDEAYKQLLRYRESLLNPPLLVVCDFDRYIVKTNFNGTVQEVHEFTSDQIDRPENWRILRALFDDPEFLKPQRTTAAVTEALAQKIAEVAKSLQERSSAELADAKTRAEMNFAQRKNLRIARFLNRIVFCLFAEDTSLLPTDLFTEILKTAVVDPSHFARTLEELFHVMATGGGFGQHKIRHFNGHLFDDSSVFELNEAELRILGEAAEADWQFIQPSIMGTLFERALDENQRSQLGAHYTSETDIKTLVEPVLMQPFRREWSEIKGELAAAYAKGKGAAAQRERLSHFQKKLAAVTVLDPACGSGNFLYVSLQLLLGLEKEVITFATQLGFSFKPQVSVGQLQAIEINPYAFELAQVSVQIGYLQWRRDNGFDNDRSPVLQVLDGFQNEDALLVPHFRNKAKTLKEARAGEHANDRALKFYTERKWPECDIILSNPPFLGDKLMRAELGGNYVSELRRVYGERIPGQSDLCCYWFEKARELIAAKKCGRAGLLATQGIRGGANREVLTRIKQSGDIFFAQSDREWILKGAMVHVSMVGFDSGNETERELDQMRKRDIPANLSSGLDITASSRLLANAEAGFIGVSMHGSFDMGESSALEIFNQGGNPNSKPNSDVLRPVLNAFEITKRGETRWLISYPPNGNLEAAAGYAAPMKFVRKNVYSDRLKNHRKTYRDNWWLPGEARPAMQAALVELPRFVATPRVSKHRVFVWIRPECIPSDATVAFARSDDFFFGLIHSRLHEVWALAHGTQLREKESGFRYTPTTCFETFPFPFRDDLGARMGGSKKAKPQTETGWEVVMESRFYTVREEPPPYHTGGAARALTPAQHRAVISAAARELNQLRENWLNPLEWTAETILEFPASVDGPWARYVVNPNSQGVGTARYPRLEPRDANCDAKLKERTLTKLYNERPAWLALAHKQLDAAVAAAYGWPADLSDEQILERLLALNFERAAEEAKAGKIKQGKPQRMKQEGELV